MNVQGVGFVGGGRVTRIILSGWKRANCMPSGIVVSDCDPAGLDRLRAAFPAITVSPDNREAARQGVVLFGLHPPVFPTVLSEIRTSLREDAVLVSLAPKWTMQRMSGVLGGFGRLARVIPNAPSIIDKGYNPICFSEQLTAAERARVSSLFTPLGDCPEVEESTLETYAIVAAMGPTYLWYQLYELVKLAGEFGLERDAALRAVAAMVHGAGSTMTDADLTAGEVIDLIPVKPLAHIESTVTQSYRETLTALHEKLRA